MCKSLVAASLVLTLAVAAGCNKQATDVGKGSKGGGPVLAEVNGTVITAEDFKKELDNLPPYLKPMTETVEGKKEMLETMVIRELILQEAKKEKLESSQEVKEKLEELKKRVVVDAYLKKKVEQLSALSDADLQKFYEENKERFKHGPEIRASHILVKEEKQAQDLLSQLKSGASFEELAKKHSVDSAATKGGDLGWFSKGSMIPEFENAAFRLKEGETSGIVKTKYGYHIIKVTGKRPAGTRPFEEVKDQIKAALEPEKQQEVFKKLREDLKKNSKYTIKEDALKALNGKEGGEAAEKPATTPKAPVPAPAPSK